MIVTLQQVWLHPLDGTPPRSFEVNAISHTPTPAVDVRRGAAGNFYAVESPGIARAAKVAFTNISDDDQAWLEAHLAAPMCYRDPRGWKLFGLYTPDSFDPRPLPDSWSVSFTFVEYTFSEAV